MKMISAVCYSVAFTKQVTLCMNRGYRNQNTDCLQENSHLWEFMNPNHAYGKTMLAGVSAFWKFHYPMSHKEIS